MLRIAMVLVSFLTLGEVLRGSKVTQNAANNILLQSFLIFGEVMRNRPDDTECCKSYPFGIIFDIGRGVAKHAGCHGMLQIAMFLVPFLISGEVLRGSRVTQNVVNNIIL